MTYRCSNLDCDHEHEKACSPQSPELQQVPRIDIICCLCGWAMFKSEVHTPVSQCSAGTGVISLGPAGSVTSAIDDFDKHLKEKLEALADEPVTGRGKIAAEQAAQKVSSWKQKISDLLGAENDDAPMSDPNTAVETCGFSLSDEERDVGSSDGDWMSLDGSENTPGAESSLESQFNNMKSKGIQS